MLFVLFFFLLKITETGCKSRYDSAVTKLRLALRTLEQEAIKRYYYNQLAEVKSNVNQFQKNVVKENRIARIKADDEARAAREASASQVKVKLESVSKKRKATGNVQASDHQSEPFLNSMHGMITSLLISHSSSRSLG